LQERDFSVFVQVSLKQNLPLMEVLLEGISKLQYMALIFCKLVLSCFHYVCARVFPGDTFQRIHALFVCNV